MPYRAKCELAVKLWSAIICIEVIAAVFIQTSENTPTVPAPFESLPFKERTVLYLLVFL